MDEDKVERLRERFLQCPVCMDEFQDPRLLPCHHTICIECIQRLLQSSATGRTFRCPQCRRDVCLPRGGVTELPVNFLIRSLQDELGEEATVGPCHICCRANLAAQFRCVDCDMDVCRFCIHQHRLVQHKDSPVVNILRMEVAGLLSSPTANRNCSTHTEETVQLFCETCQQPLCVRCSCGEHRKHHFLSLGEKLHGSREHLQQRLEGLMRDRRAVRSWLRQLEAAEIEVKDNGARTLATVRHRAQELHSLLDKMADTVMDKVRYREQQQLTDVAACKWRMVKLAQRLDLGVDFLRGLQEVDVSLELLDAFQAFSSDLADIRRSATSKMAIPMCDQKFLLGHQLEFNGFLLGTFGSLRTSYSYFYIDNTQPSLLWKISRRLTLTSLLKCLMLVVLLYPVINLLVQSYSTPYDHETFNETIAALCLTTYLFLCACFAFRKSKSLSL